MINILVVDDELPARERLVRMIGELANGGWQVAGTAENGQKAVDFCRQNPVDIVLMDIRMPIMDGLQAAGLLAAEEKPPAVIFTTAYGEYALDAFEAKGIGYLLKPIKKQHLQETLSRVQQLNRAQLQMVDQRAPGRIQRTYISGSYRGAVVRIALDDIIYFLAEQKYVIASTGDKDVLLDESLKSLEDRFARQFVRIHRNALVASEKISGVEKKQGQQPMLILQGVDKKLEISRRQLSSIKHLLKSGH